jgi:hypothetical protein
MSVKHAAMKLAFTPFDPVSLRGSYDELGYILKVYTDGTALVELKDGGQVTMNIDNLDRFDGQRGLW